KSHSTLGFDISINASLARVPGADRNFNIKKLDLKNLVYVEEESSSPLTPTAFGNDQPGPTMASYYTNPQTGQREQLFNFDMPQGAGFHYVPAPMIQASVGLIKKTDISLRYMPSISLPKDINLNLFGVGLKHDITQWLPGDTFIPDNIAIQAGFTKLNTSIDFEVTPPDRSDIKNDYAASTWEGQKADLSSNAFTMNALVGKSLPFVAVYGGFGYETSSLRIRTPGSYPIVVPNEDYQPNNTDSKSKIIQKVKNPIDISYGNESSFRGLLGLRLKLGFFNINASYTLSRYPVGRVGIGFSFR